MSTKFDKKTIFYAKTAKRYTRLFSFTVTFLLWQANFQAVVPKARRR